MGLTSPYEKPEAIKNIDWRRFGRMEKRVYRRGKY
jgi:hypothetical protein